jgi:hypothetical protein
MTKNKKCYLNVKGAGIQRIPTPTIDLEFIDLEPIKKWMQALSGTFSPCIH